MHFLGKSEQSIGFPTHSRNHRYHFVILANRTGYIFGNRLDTLYRTNGCSAVFFNKKRQEFYSLADLNFGCAIKSFLNSKVKAMGHRLSSGWLRQPIP